MQQWSGVEGHCYSTKTSRKERRRELSAEEKINTMCVTRSMHATSLNHVGIWQDDPSWQYLLP
jgi:hypothetical protein